jgi:hypothetical protein
MFKQITYGILGVLVVLSFCILVHIKTNGIINLYDQTVTEFQFGNETITYFQKNCAAGGEVEAKIKNLIKVANDRKFDRAVISKQQETIYILLALFAFTSILFIALEIRRKKIGQLRELR